MEALGINLGYLLSQILNFLVLFLLLQFVLYKPLLNMMAQRRERIAEGINNARKAEEALASAEADKQKILDEARAEAQKIIIEARARAEESAQQVTVEAEEEARRIRGQVDADVTAERDRLLADMRDQIVSLSIAAANHLLGTGMDEATQRKSVESFFTTMPAGAKDLGDSFFVVTAVPLTDDEKASFKKQLETDDVTFQTDPGILGGVIVRAGGRQLDGSFANQLAEMRASLS